MSKDKLLSDEELATKLIRIAKGIGKTYDDSIDAKLEQSILNLINTQKRLYAESEKLKELNRVHFEAMANSRENLLERILQRMKFCEEELGSAESEDVCEEAKEFQLAKQTLKNDAKETMKEKLNG